MLATSLSRSPACISLRIRSALLLHSFVTIHTLSLAFILSSVTLLAKLAQRQGERDTL